VDDSAEFALFVSRLQAGDPEAIALAYRRFGPYLRTAVRRRLHPQLRTRFDSLDFVQDVWTAFLGTLPSATRFDSPDALIVYLGHIAHNKVVDVTRQRFVSERDSANAEVQIDEAVPARRDRVLAHDPTPSQCAIAGEEFERILSQFPPGHRVIVERLREGYNNEDIARMANVSRSTVDRVVRRLKELAGV
jgi:RNA polymerase sigma factor (sigma-70 family)